MFIEFLGKVLKFFYCDGEGYRCQITPSRTGADRDGDYSYNAVYALSGEMYDELREVLPDLPETPWEIQDEKDAALCFAICSPAPLVRQTPFTNEKPFGICTFSFSQSPLTGDYVSEDFAAAVKELYSRLGKPAPATFPRASLATIEFKETTVSSRDRQRSSGSKLSGLFGTKTEPTKTEPTKLKMARTDFDDQGAAEIKAALTKAGITGFAANAKKTDLTAYLEIV